MTELLQARTDTHRRPLGTLPTVGIGLFGGFALGVASRAWMRFISSSPEFTWGGTLGIVIGFTVFGFVQSIVAVVRRRSPRRWKLTIVRVFGGIFMLQLFVAAGAVMLPTVLGAGLARARGDWHWITRSIWLVVASGPVIFVASDLHDNFGWSWRTVTGLSMMLAIYAIIIAATRFTLSPQEDGWHLLRWKASGRSTAAQRRSSRGAQP